MSYTSDDAECVAEFVDGVYDTQFCGCPDCREAEDEEIGRQNEAGYITDAQARARYAALEQRRTLEGVYDEADA